MEKVRTSLRCRLHPVNAASGAHGCVDNIWVTVVDAIKTAVYFKSGVAVGK